MGIRLLLDQNFPGPITDVADIDGSVEYVGLWTFDPALTAGGTPDWLIYLRAAEDGSFDAIVTRDANQLSSPEELVALIDTGLSVITWRSPVEDPIQEWGQLIAYMPLVRRKLENEGGPLVIHLPKPRLSADNITNPRALLGRLASQRSTTFPAVRDDARRHMSEELALRGFEDLMDLLGG